MKKLVLTIGILITSISTFSHVALDYPAGGENFHPGQTVTIVWHELIQHNTVNWDLYFSDDGGATWQDLRLNIGIDTLMYDWTVPDIITDQGRIKVVQDNVGGNYEDESFDFSITASSGIAAERTEIPIEIYPNPTNDFVWIKSTSTVNFNEVRLLGPDGRILENIDFEADLNDISDQRISLQGYAPGIYYLVAFSEDKKAISKIIKN